MRRNKIMTLVRLVLALLALSWAGGLCLAQSQGNGQSTAAQAQAKGLPAGCKAGQRRCINNNHRRAASERAAARRAAAAQKKQAEVKP